LQSGRLLIACRATTTVFPVVTTSDCNMTSTLATDKQSEAIRKRMNEIRNSLPYEVDDARRRLKELSDWKYHFRRHPYALMGLGLTLGFLLVPGKGGQQWIVHHKQGSERRRSPGGAESDWFPGEAEPAKKGLVGGLLGAAASVALKQGATIVARQLAHRLTSSDASRHQGPASQHYASAIAEPSSESAK
jgi:hypothetical protein